MTDAVRISCERVKKLTKTQRLHDVMARIYEIQKFTVDEPAQEFHVSYRTMLRYLQELSGMGVPLYSEVGKHGGYSLLKNSSFNRLSSRSIV
ncbi:HTH domain-containing protein [Paenibacillus sp. GbtcB18]|uniref:HTH domain-containing protein n=1 Tax=Paenibacillus sp. GbtcB18 TaxID=2824763 RepID=UPI0028152BE5|nr:HTH domain-containing protein [Paenibacillus sp. GbtcB18]